MIDLVVSGGTVVDGTGGEPRTADVAIDGGRIVDIGTFSGVARRRIDASGAIVTPGFVDVHTHYDGQVSWDETLTPSSLHGVTTAVLGNCGVGFAPVRERDRETLVRLMEGVEDIPGAALSEGIRWGWESFPEYMRVLDAMPHSIDFALQVPHDALRVYVMGERAVRGEPATDADIEAMRALLADSLRAGAIGFSTGRTDNHRSADGRTTPAAEASLAELTGLARAFEGIPHGVIQAVSDFDMAAGSDRFDAEMDLLLAMARAARGHRMSVSLLQRVEASEQWTRILARAESAQKEGLDLRVQVAARAIGVLLGLEATFHPFIGFPSYKRISQLPLAERVAAMRDPAFKARMLAEKSEPVAGDGSAVPPLADKLLASIDFVAMRLFRMGETPDYEPDPKRSLYGESLARGVPVLEVIYDAMLEDDGRELLYFPLYNYGTGNLDAVRTMLAHPLALAGLSDGGAHVGTVCDASFPSFMLSYWARDRRELSLPRVVSMISRETAEHVGLRDRGVLAVGKRADLNVIDLAALRLTRPRMFRDLPAGGRRLVQDARGYLATLVAGEVVRDADGMTAARPGHLARAGA